MTYKQLRQLKPRAFKRRCGVQQETFEPMVTVLRPAVDRTGNRGGQCKLCVEAQLLVEYCEHTGHSSISPPLGG